MSTGMKTGPDFIGLGAQRAGSTWLFTMLNQHPDVSFSIKEVRFFNERGGFSSRSIASNYLKGLDWYLGQLSLAPDKCCGEVTPHYLWDRHAPERIHKHFPDVKLIAVVRHPVERAHSQYLLASSVKTVASSFEEAWDNFADIRERGLYMDQLNRYLRYFRKEQIKVVFFDELKASPDDCLLSIEEFLGLQPFVPDNVDTKVNAAKYPRSKTIARLAERVHSIKSLEIGQRLWSMPWFAKFSTAAYRLLRRYNRKDGEKPEIDPALRQRMIEFYRRDIEALEAFCQKDLSAWKQ